MHLIGSTKIENEQKFAYAEKYYTKNGYIVFKLKQGRNPLGL